MVHTSLWKRQWPQNLRVRQYLWIGLDSSRQNIKVTAIIHMWTAYTQWPTMSTAPWRDQSRCRDRWPPHPRKMIGLTSPEPLSQRTKAHWWTARTSLVILFGSEPNAQAWLQDRSQKSFTTTRDHNLSLWFLTLLYKINLLTSTISAVYFVVWMIKI